MPYKKGHQPNLDVRNKMRLAKLGKKRPKFSEIHKKNISISAKKGAKKQWENQEYRKKMSESHRGKLREKSSHWKGGLSKIQKLELKAGRKKPNDCELCGRVGKICFDHNHKTGKFRGWICMKCNSALGMVDDNIQTLKLLIEYVERNN